MRRLRRAVVLPNLLREAGILMGSRALVAVQFEATRPVMRCTRVQNARALLAVSEFFGLLEAKKAIPYEFHTLATVLLGHMHFR